MIKECRNFKNCIWYVCACPRWYVFMYVYGHVAVRGRPWIATLVLFYYMYVCLCLPPWEWMTCRRTHPWRNLILPLSSGWLPVTRHRSGVLLIFFYSCWHIKWSHLGNRIVEVLWVVSLSCLDDTIQQQVAWPSGSYSLSVFLFQVAPEP